MVLPDGSNLLIQIYYRQQQTGWFFNQILWGKFELDGLAITNSPNMLRQWKNIIPFGLACFTQGNREPTQLEDFSSGASSIYVLTAEEVQQFEDYLSGK